MITDNEVQTALDYLQNNANEDAQAKANREHMSDYLKVVLAEQTQKFLDAGLSFSAADCKAKTSQEYKNALVNKKTATEEDVRRYFMRQACEARIEAWRTFSSNQRAIGKLQ